MKKPFLLASCRRCAPRRSLPALLCGFVIACSSTDPELVAQTQPSTPDTSGPAAPGPSPPGPDTPEPVTVLGSPGDEIPVSAPPENDGPGATETNWLTLPCGKQRPDAGGADGAADAGAPEPGVDAGATGDRCSPEAP
jgi:hypothetical protein